MLGVGELVAASAVMLRLFLSAGLIVELLKPHRVCLVTPILLGSAAQTSHTLHAFLVSDWC